MFFAFHAMKVEAVQVPTVRDTTLRTHTSPWVADHQQFGSKKKTKEKDKDMEPSRA